MSNHIRTLLAMATMLVLLSTVLNMHPATAAEYDGEHWQSTFIWYVDISCPTYVKPTVEAVLEKHSPVAHLFISTWSLGVSQDSSNVIYCGYSDVQEMQLQQLPYRLEAATSETTAGRARWYFYREQQKIVECDVWFSSGSLTEETVELYVLHEVVGHCMGLQHSIDRDAVMYFAPTATGFRVDDYAGLTELYRLCREKDYIDTLGNKYIARMDVEDLLAVLDNREHDMYRGVELSGYLDANTMWPSGLYNIKESSCNEY